MTLSTATATRQRARRLPTINDAIKAARLGLANVARGDIDENVEVYASCPFTSGHVFLTCRIYGVVYAMFLAPEDKFSTSAVRPKCWESFGSGWTNTNWAACEDDAAHEAHHFALLARVKDKNSSFCPGRLRKFRK